MPLWSELLTFSRPNLSVAESMNLRGRRDGARVIACGGHEHLHHRAGLVDLADDGVDEDRGILAGRSAVVVGVVAGDARPGQDLAGVGIHDDGRGHLGAVGDPGRVELLLEHQLEAGVDGQADVRAGHAGVHEALGVGDDASRDVALRREHPGAAAEQVLEALLDAVLALAVPVGEAEQPAGQRRVRGAALVRDRPAPAGARARASRAAGPGRDPPWRPARRRSGRRVRARKRTAYSPPRRERLAELRRRLDVQLEDPRQLAGDALAIGGIDARRVGGEQVAIGRGGQDDRAAAIEDVAAHGRLGDGPLELRHGARPHLRATHDLPVGEPQRERARQQHEADEQEEEAQAPVGPTQHRSISAPARARWCPGDRSRPAGRRGRWRARRPSARCRPRPRGCAARCRPARRPVRRCRSG